MEEKLLFETSHIKLIEVQNGELCIEIDDRELQDFIEDFLWDNFQITEDSVDLYGIVINGKNYYRNYYGSDVKSDDLIKALSQLDLQEVERIYKLNNK